MHGILISKEGTGLPMELTYPLAGLIVLIAVIAFLKTLDFLAAQTVKRLLEMADAHHRRQSDAF